MSVGDAYETLAGAIAEVHTRRRPVLFGVAGGVAVGKSTTARRVGERLGDLGLVAEVLPTDAFLMTNAELSARGLDLRKGFPDSYDRVALVGALAQLRRGERTEVPVYSHLTYDRVAGASQVLEPDLDVVVLEGVNALQEPAVGMLDLSVYVDADEGHARAWFVDRFLRLCAEGAEDPTSFYAPLAGLDREDQRAVAETAWSTINLMNLRAHIHPSRLAATYVLRKDIDHAVVELRAGSERG